jgi:hypothetical protein
MNVKHGRDLLPYPINNLQKRLPGALTRVGTAHRKIYRTIIDRMMKGLFVRADSCFQKIVLGMKAPQSKLKGFAFQ